MPIETTLSAIAALVAAAAAAISAYMYYLAYMRGPDIKAFENHAWGLPKGTFTTHLKYHQIVITNKGAQTGVVTGVYVKINGVLFENPKVISLCGENWEHKQIIGPIVFPLASKESKILNIKLNYDEFMLPVKPEEIDIKNKDDLPNGVAITIDSHKDTAPNERIKKVYISLEGVENRLKDFEIVILTADGKEISVVKNIVNS